MEHVSYTVPDLDSAVAFFVRALGAKELYRKSIGASTPEEAIRWARQLNTAVGASLEFAKMDLYGTLFELFEYAARDLDARMPRNCDAGGGHFGLHVPDLDVAISQIAAYPGVRILGEPVAVPDDHHLRGRRWIYFLSPWGLQMELASGPTR